MVGCTAALSWMRHDPGGTVLALGRRRRRPNAAQRRAARDRDQGRCRFPGCGSRRTDLHHIVYWSHGGRLDLDHAIYVCFANERTARDKQQDPAGPARRGGARVYEPEECAELARQYLENAPRYTAPILIPIEV